MSTVYVRDLKIGTVVILHPRAFSGTSHVPREATVACVARAADLIEPARAAVAAAKSRAAILAAANDLIEVLEAIADYGREAHRVRFEGDPRPRTYESSATFEWCGQRSAARP